MNHMFTDNQCELWLLTREGRVISAWPTKVQALMANGMNPDGIIQGTFTTREGDHVDNTDNTGT